MQEMRIFVLLSCYLSLIPAITKADDLDGQTILQVYHSLEPGPVPKYELRGFININSGRNGEAMYLQEEVLSSEEVDKLKQLAETDGMYRVQLIESNDKSDRAVFSFTKACGIYESGLTDELTISLDQAGHPVGIAVSATPAHCSGEPVSHSKLQTFNTTVNIVSLVNAPSPDTLTYIQRLEQEKAEKARGDQGDNRSFFSKYWMYIVPLVIFLFISGASGPEGQAGAR